MDCTALKSAMAEQGYVASDDLAMAVHLALALGRPLLLEGAAGVLAGFVVLGLGGLLGRLRS